MSEPAEIAAKLTKAQRERLPSLTEPFKFLTWEGLEYVEGLAERCGYEHRFGGHTIYRLTPLGLAVRRHLLENGNG